MGKFLSKDNYLFFCFEFERINMYGTEFKYYFDNISILAYVYIMNINIKKIASVLLVILFIAGAITFSFDNPLRSALSLRQFSVSSADKSQQTIINSQGGTYAKYSYNLVRNAKGNIVIFVGAKWCITCQNTDKSIITNVNSIPGDLTILNLDFDENKEVLKKYEVLIQHTFVKIDSQGKFIKKDANLGEFASGIEKLDKIIEFSK